MANLDRRSVLGLALASAAARPALAAPDAEPIRRDIAAFAERALTEMQTAPGLAIAVVRGSQTIYAAGFGLADTAPPRRADADSAFYIASSTKSFTALAIASLARKELVDLDAPIADLDRAGLIAPAISRQVTLRDMLSHRAGIDNGPIAYRAAYSGEHTPAVMRELLRKTVVTPVTPRGAFRYANANYNVATVLLEQTLGLSWQAVVQREVLGQLGMNATTPFISKARRDGRAVAAGFSAVTPGAPERCYLQKVDATMHSAGGLVSSAHDMAKWLKVQVADGMLDGRRVFPRGLVEATHRPLVDVGKTFGAYRRDAYGLGWYLGDYRGQLLMHHFGNFGGSRAHVSFMPARGVGVCVMINEDGVAGDLADLVANYVYDRLAERADLAAVYNTQLTDFKAITKARQTQLATVLRERAQRPSTLTQPVAAYAGLYRSAAYGHLEITAKDSRLEVRVGVQHALADPFTAPNVIRVELSPLQGDTIGFQVGPEGKIAAATFQGDRFARVS